MQHNQMSAKKIYELWCRNQNHEIFRDNYSPARRYFIEVRDAMYQELVDKGNCELIEQLLQAKDVDAVSYRAMCDALQAVSEKKNLLDVNENGIVVDFNTYSCRDLSGTIYSIWMNASMRNEMNGLYQKIKNSFRGRREQPRQAADGEPHAATTRSAAPQQPNSVLTEAARQRDAMLAAARKQHDSIIQQANAQRDSIEKDANTQRGNIITEANCTASRIVDEAKAKAERIQADATRQAEEVAHEEAQRLIQQQLSHYMNQQRSQWEEDRQALENARADMSSAVPTLKEDVCGITTAAGAQMNRSLDTMVEHLNGLKSELLINLNRWRSDLYKCEYGPLINFYMNFVTVADQFERDVFLEQMQPMTEDQQQTILQRHSSRMNSLQNNLGRAMEAMGIRTFTPQPGDVFDSYYHAANDAEDDDLYNGSIIESCVSPGVQRTVNGQVTEVLHRATVTVRSEE